MIGLSAALVEFVFFAVAAVLGVIVVSRVIRSLTGCRRHPDRMAESSRGSWVCGKTDCRAENPEHARYCKQCGLQRVPTDFGE